MIKMKHSAVSPRFFQEFRDIDDFVNEYGFHQWRFSLAVPSSSGQTWVQSFREWCEELTVLERKKALRLLELGRINEALVNFPSSETGVANTWKQNAEAIDKRKVDFVIGDALDPDPFEPWVEALPNIRESRRSEIRYSATVDDIVSQLRPLLVCAPATYIVDPYFLPGSENATKLLRALMSEIKGSCCYKVHVVTRDPFRSRREDDKAVLKDLLWPADSFLSFEEGLRSTFKDALPAGLSLAVHLVHDRIGGHEFLKLHERFVINRYGALQFDRGLTLTAALEKAYTVARRTHQEKWELFSDQVVRFSERLPRKLGQERPFFVSSCVIK